MHLNGYFCESLDRLIETLGKIEQTPDSKDLLHDLKKHLRCLHHHWSFIIAKDRLLIHSLALRIVAPAIAQAKNLLENAGIQVTLSEAENDDAETNQAPSDMGPKSIQSNMPEAPKDNENARTSVPEMLLHFSSMKPSDFTPGKASEALAPILPEHAAFVDIAADIFQQNDEYLSIPNKLRLLRKHFDAFDTDLKDLHHDYFRLIKPKLSQVVKNLTAQALEAADQIEDSIYRIDFWRPETVEVQGRFKRKL